MPERLPLKNTICVTNRLLLVFLARSCEFEPIVTRLDENLAAKSIVQIHCGSHQMAFGCGSAALCNLWMLIQKLKRADFKPPRSLR